jgi:hypothetical protein
MKYLLLLLPLAANAGTYIEYKNTLPLTDSATTHDLRLGVKGDNLYFESGMYEKDGETGVSYETGYKFRWNSLEFKGKVEGRRSNSKIETEIRYNF